MTTNTAENKILSISLMPNALYYGVVNGGEIAPQKQIVFEQNNLFNLTKNAFQENLALLQSYNKVFVSVLNFNFNLIPEEYFEKNRLAEILKFNTNECQNVSYNNLERLCIKLVFSLNDEVQNIKDFILSKHADAIFQHSGSVFINHVYARSLRPEIHINIHLGYLEIIVFIEQKLQLYNIFEVKTNDDLLYYVLFIAEQLKHDPNTDKIYYYGSVNDDLAKLLQKYIRFLIAGEDKEITQTNFTLIKQTCG